MKRRTLKKVMLLIPAVVLAFLLIFTSFYAYWNSASPQKTCASCHEIGRSVDIFALSAHRALKCSECHGTALSNGMHSLKEKGYMVVSHVKNKYHDDIRMKEEQVLEVADNCARCHASEHAGWRAGGHSLAYGDFLLNEKHNTTEQLNFDCLRCHGMFSEQDIMGLVKPIDIRGPWKLKDNALSARPAIPCLACHQVHAEGIPAIRPDYANPVNIFYQRKPAVFKAGFYNRPDKIYYTAANLPKLNLWEGEWQVEVSDDPLMRNCVQCHAPDAYHQAGTSDDRTPRGVHEGISCLACHNPHSNDARQSCQACHPAISNCRLDVTTMNTTFSNPESPYNIHWVGCTDCHKEKTFRRK
jgi:hypothetical protein